MTAQQEASEFFAAAIDEAFRGHGIDSRVENSRVYVGDALRISASSQVSESKPDDVRIQLDVVTEATVLGRAGPIVDSFAGVGASLEEAQKNALMKFLIASFHVVAEACASHVCDSDQVEWEDWRADAYACAWRVCSGPLLTQSTGECATSKQYSEVMQELQSEFERRADPGPHWLRVFAGFIEGKLHSCEAILDGHHWAEGVAILQQASWSPASPYETLRHLMVALPASADRLLKS